MHCRYMCIILLTFTVGNIYSEGLSFFPSDIFLGGGWIPTFRNVLQTWLQFSYFYRKICFKISDFATEIFWIASWMQWKSVLCFRTLQWNAEFAMPIDTKMKFLTRLVKISAVRRSFTEPVSMRWTGRERWHYLLHFTPWRQCSL